MKALAIIGCSVSCSVVGGLVGAFLGDREDRNVAYGNFGISTMLFGAMGMVAGGLVGVVAGAVKFA